jgi:hypothetical protein
MPAPRIESRFVDMSNRCGVERRLQLPQRGSQLLQRLAEVSNEIFEEQLDGCYRVPSVWPAARDLRAFLLWFDCSFHSLVVDLCDERLRHTDVVS